MIKSYRQFHTHNHDYYGKKMYYHWSKVPVPVVIKLTGMNPKKSHEFLNYNK